MCVPTSNSRLGEAFQFLSIPVTNSPAQPVRLLPCVPGGSLLFVLWLIVFRRNACNLLLPGTPPVLVSLERSRWLDVLLLQNRCIFLFIARLFLFTFWGMPLSLQTTPAGSPSPICRCLRSPPLPAAVPDAELPCGAAPAPVAAISAASCSGSRELPRSSCPSAGASSALADRGGQRGKGKRFPLPCCPRVLSSAGPSLGLRWGGFSAGDEPFAVLEPAERGAERRLRWSDAKRRFPGSECSLPSPLPPGFILEV